MDFDNWCESLRRLAKASDLTYLLSNDDGDYIEQWEDGDTPQQAMQALYEDAGCPVSEQ